MLYAVHHAHTYQIVDEASATVGAATEEIIPINGHHTQITRYAKDSNNYAIVLSKLRQHVASPGFANCMCMGSATRLLSTSAATDVTISEILHSANHTEPAAYL